MNRFLSLSLITFGIGLFVLSFPSPSTAQTTTWRPKQLPFTSYTSKNILPNNYITNFHFDTLGYIWLGSRYGFYRYDGYQVKSYDYPYSGKQAFSENSLAIRLIDSKNRIWLTSYKSMSHLLFNPDIEQFITLAFCDKNEFGFDRDMLFHTLEDNFGNVWATSYNGLVKFSFSSDTSLPHITRYFNKPYPDSVFKFFNYLKHQGNECISFSKTKESLHDQTTHTIELEGGTYQLLSIFNKKESYTLTKEGVTIWTSSIDSSTNVKGSVNIQFQHTRLKLEPGVYTLTERRKKSYPSYGSKEQVGATEQEWLGLSLLKISEKESIQYDSLWTDYYQHKYDKPATYGNSHFLAKAPDGNLWVNFSNFEDGLQKLYINNGREYRIERYRDTVFLNGEIRKWKNEYFYPLDERYLLFIGSNHAYLDLGGLVYPMAIFDSKQEKLIPISHDITKLPSVENSGYGHLIKNIWQENSGKFWMATFTHGLVSFFLPKNWQDSSHITLDINGFSARPLTHKPTDKVEQIFDVDPDPYGNLWISTNGKGIFKIDLSYNSAQAIPYPSDFDKTQLKKPLLELGNTAWYDKKGTLWLVQKPNYTAWYSDSLQRFVPFLDFSGKPLQWNSTFEGLVFEDDSGDFWTASKGSIIQKLSRNTRKLVSYPIPTHFDVKNFFQDPSGTIWAIDVSSSFYRFNQEKSNFEFIDLYPSQSQVKRWDGVYAVRKDTKGNIWCTYHAGGLAKLSYKSLSHGRDTLILQEYLPETRCLGLYIDERDDLWLGTNQGLWRFDPTLEEIVEKIGPEQGLDGPRYKYVYRDKKGRFWLYRNKGIALYLPKSKRTIIPEPFTEFELFELPAHSETGKLSIAYSEGIISLDAARFEPDSIPPFVHIETLQTRTDKEAKTYLLALEPSPIRLSWNQNDLAINFTAIHYDQPQKNQFQYQLLESNDNWIDADQSRIARFTNLSPQTYTFQVRAANPTGIWSKPTRITFTILPPWWRTWWAYGLYGIGFFGIIYLFYQFQLKRRLAISEAHKYREIDKVKSRLYTNITHEFRTPLTIIEGMADQIKGQNQAKQLIRKNSRKLLQLINQLLELAKLEVGRIELSYVQADILLFLKYELESLQSLAEAKSIHLQFDSNSDSLFMDFDPDKIHHIINNLLSNSLKFTPNGGKIELGAFRHSSPEKDQLEITVSDTGIGIPKEKLDLVFDRFYQVDDSNTRSGEGSGIGLSLVKELVVLMQGEVSVESEEYAGTTFRILLPIQNKAKQGTFASIPTEEHTDISVDFIPNTFLEKNVDAPRVLIVEDNKDVIYYIKSLLSEAYQIMVASNGKEGIRLAQEIIPDIILSDVMMPEVDGLELCKTLKNNFTTSHIPIILLTAKGDIDSKITGLSGGADSYLSKPFNARELTTRIEQLIEARKRLQSYFSSGTPLTAKLPSEPSIQVEHEFLEKLQNWVFQNMASSPIRIATVADAMHMDRTQLYRKVQALTGLSPSRYLRKIRLQHADKLLTSTHLNMSEIAHACGFSDLAYFSNCYKEEFGISPSKRRE